MLTKKNRCQTMTNQRTTKPKRKMKKRSPNSTKTTKRNAETAKKMMIFYAWAPIWQLSVYQRSEPWPSLWRANQKKTNQKMTTKTTKLRMRKIFLVCVSL